MLPEVYYGPTDELLHVNNHTHAHDDSSCSTTTCCTDCTYGASSGSRPCTDFQMASHAPFLSVFVLSIYMHFYEMTLLVGLVLVFSLLYHAGAEARTCWSYVDNCAAFTLSMYGNVQLFFSPSAFVLALNLSLGITSATIFGLGFTATFAPYYHVMHPIGLHILPAIWSGVVVLYQKPFLF